MVVFPFLKKKGKKPKYRGWWGRGAKEAGGQAGKESSPRNSLVAEMRHHQPPNCSALQPQEKPVLSDTRVHFTP